MMHLWSMLPFTQVGMGQIASHCQPSYPEGGWGMATVRLDPSFVVGADFITSDGTALPQGFSHLYGGIKGA